jgi:hypothetical protein
VLRGIRARLTYTNVIATIALFVLVGGTGYASSQISRSDVMKIVRKKETRSTFASVFSNQQPKIPSGVGMIVFDDNSGTRHGGPLTTAGDSRIIANASVTARNLKTETAVVSCQLLIRGIKGVQKQFDQGSSTSIPPERNVLQHGTVSTTGAIDKPAGTYTISVNCEAGGGSEVHFINGDLTAIAVAK